MFVVWRKSKSVPYFPVGSAPTITHESYHDAVREASRLAEKHPGDTFAVLKVCGEAKASAAVYHDFTCKPDGIGQSFSVR